MKRMSYELAMKNASNKKMSYISNEMKQISTETIDYTQRISRRRQNKKKWDWEKSLWVAMSHASDRDDVESNNNDEEKVQSNKKSKKKTKRKRKYNCYLVGWVRCVAEEIPI